MPTGGQAPPLPPSGLKDDTPAPYELFSLRSTTLARIEVVATMYKTIIDAINATPLSVYLRKGMRHWRRPSVKSQPDGLMMTTCSAAL
jgi:hypothetical protein